MPGKTTKPESIRPGSRTFCSTCESAVSQEVLAPFGVARSLSFLNRVDSAGRARGLCGAPVGARGRRPSPEDLHRLDPDGWLVQSSIDTNSIESPAEQRRTRGANEKPVTPQPRGIRSSFLISLCLLDTRLQMGGTYSYRHLSVGQRFRRAGIHDILMVCENDELNLISGPRRSRQLQT